MGRLSAEPDAQLIPLDEGLLRRRVRELYSGFTDVAPEELHFETGSELALRLGYPRAQLDLVPTETLAAFAGVGYHLDLAELSPGESVVDVGAGSGTDAIIAAHGVGAGGRVAAVDATPAQASRARRAATTAGATAVQVVEGNAEVLPLPDGSADVVISNGVVNLLPDKVIAFAEIARVLRPGGRLAISDVVSERPIGARARCNVNLWAECVAGAEPVDEYLATVEGAGLRVVAIRENPAYAFREGRASAAAERWGVRSISLAAVRA